MSEPAHRMQKQPFSHFELPNESSGSTRKRQLLPALLPIVIVLITGCTGGEPEQAAAPTSATPTEGASTTVRIALFNIRELSLEKLDAGDGSTGTDPQARAAAEIIAEIDPDVLVVQEIDWDADNPTRAAETFRDRYLEPVGASGYTHVFAAPSNTGLLSGVDLDNDGVVADSSHVGSRVHGNDSFGFGTYPGQYSMAVLSRLPLDESRARTFQRFLWKDLPDHHLPRDFYSEEAQDIFRLSSKSHWDLPLSIGTQSIRLLISHPTPPVFDGDEDRNGRRNFDEIAFWQHYLTGVAFRDDQGLEASFPEAQPFVLIGDLNARPDGDATYQDRTAISQLLEHPRIQPVGDHLTSRGALAGREEGAPSFYERATATFGGGSRVDYLLPSIDLEIHAGGVYWPGSENEVGAQRAENASDHRLLWLDIELD